MGIAMKTPSPTRHSESQHSAAALTLIEHDILQHVARALEVSLQWKVADVSFSRKLQSVRFTAQSFTRHLERLLVLEEDGGYMDLPEACKPHWAGRLSTLRRQHDTFRARLSHIMPALDHPSASEEQFERLCAELHVLLSELATHHRDENALLQEMLYAEDGGES